MPCMAALVTPGAAPFRGDILRATVHPAFLPEEQPGLFFVDEGTKYSDITLVRESGTRPTRLRTVALDGRELWDHRYGGRRVKHVAADPHGGVVIVREAGDDGNPAGPWIGDTVTKLDGRTGAVVWRREASELYGRFSQVAIHPDGTVYVGEDHDVAPSILWGIAGDTGAATAWPLPSGLSNSGGLVAAGAAGPIIDAEGAVQLVAAVWSGGGSTAESRTMRLTLPEGGGWQVREVSATGSWYQTQDALRDYPSIRIRSAGAWWWPARPFATAPWCRSRSCRRSVRRSGRVPRPSRSGSPAPNASGSFRRRWTLRRWRPTPTRCWRD